MKVSHCASFLPAVNSVCWAPHDYGLILACGSSDGAISLLTYTGLGQWEVKKINNAHTVSPHPACGLRPRHVSALPSLEKGRSSVTAVQCATGGLLSRTHWEGRSEALCTEARQRLHPGRPGCTCLIQPRAALALVSPSQGGPGHWQGGSSSLPICHPCCAHHKLTWPAVTIGAPGTDWCHKKHHRKLVLCFLCKGETVKEAL